MFEEVLFVGDLLISRDGVLHKSYKRLAWDMRQLIDSAHAMNNLKFNWVCPAHGEPVKTSRIEIG
ncbi:MAG: hypothetical protein FWG61_04190 [Firmicutes bacterium]|nr:hypothetical protein [Bacillota bacterium]